MQKILPRISGKRRPLICPRPDAGRHNEVTMPHMHLGLTARPSFLTLPGTVSV